MQHQFVDFKNPHILARTSTPTSQAGQVFQLCPIKNCA